MTPLNHSWSGLEILRTAGMRRDEEEVCLGTVRWLGRLHELYGQQIVAGVILVRAHPTFQKLKRLYHEICDLRILLVNITRG